MHSAAKTLSDFALALLIALLIIAVPKYRRLGALRAAYELGKRSGRK